MDLSVNGCSPTKWLSQTDEHENAVGSFAGTRRPKVFAVRDFPKGVGNFAKNINGGIKKAIVFSTEEQFLDERTMIVRRPPILQENVAQDMPSSSQNSLTPKSPTSPKSILPFNKQKRVTARRDFPPGCGRPPHFREEEIKTIFAARRDFPLVCGMAPHFREEESNRSLAPSPEEGLIMENVAQIDIMGTNKSFLTNLTPEPSSLRKRNFVVKRDFPPGCGRTTSYLKEVKGREPLCASSGGNSLGKDTPVSEGPLLEDATQASLDCHTIIGKLKGKSLIEIEDDNRWRSKKLNVGMLSEIESKRNDAKEEAKHWAEVIKRGDRYSQGLGPMKEPTYDLGDASQRIMHKAAVGTTIPNHKQDLLSLNGLLGRVIDQGSMAALNGSWMLNQKACKSNSNSTKTMGEFPNRKGNNVLEDFQAIGAKRESKKRAVGSKNSLQKQVLLSSKESQGTVNVQGLMAAPNCPWNQKRRGCMYESANIKTQGKVSKKKRDRILEFQAFDGKRTRKEPKDDVGDAAQGKKYKATVGNLSPLHKQCPVSLPRLQGRVIVQGLMAAPNKMNRNKFNNKGDTVLEDFQVVGTKRTGKVLQFQNSSHVGYESIDALEGPKPHTSVDKGCTDTGVGGKMMKPEDDSGHVSHINSL